MPKISVIVPIYNVEKYLPKCLDSILGQTFADFELICVNDGSTDKSLEILQRYAAQDTRIIVINQENQGLSMARNSGLVAAKGDFIAFADSDDFYAPNFLELLMQAQKSTNADIVGCNFLKIYSSKDTLKPVHNVSPKVYKNVLNVLLHRKNFIHFNVWNKLYRREVIGDVLFVPHIYYEDWVFNCCVFNQAKNFAWVAEKLYAYRLSNNSIMRSDFNEKKIKDYVSGIYEVHNYFRQNAPEKWQKVRNTRISRTVKMMMNSTLHAKNPALYTAAQTELKELYRQNLISYAGLSFFNKLKLFKFLH